MKQYADAMLAAAATVLGRLVEQSLSATPAARSDHEGSIHTDGDALVVLSEIPAVNAQIVIRFSNEQIGRVVNKMIGGADDAAEMGAMQMSIVSETVSQIAVAMSEALCRDFGVAADAIKADVVTDATLLPPPPFESYEGKVRVSGEIEPQIAIDFAAITLSKLQSASQFAEPVAASAPEPVAAAPAPAAVASGSSSAAAQAVTFAPMQPTPIKAAHPGQSNLDLVHDIPLQISAVLGQTALPLRDVVALSAGSVFELDKNSTDPIDLYVNNILIARGEVVVVDDKFAVKISELNPHVQ